MLHKFLLFSAALCFSVGIREVVQSCWGTALDITRGAIPIKLIGRYTSAMTLVFLKRVRDIECFNTIFFFRESELFLNSHGFVLYCKVSNLSFTFLYIKTGIYLSVRAFVLLENRTFLFCISIYCWMIM